VNTDNKDRNNEHETPATENLRRKPAPRPSVEIDVDYYQSIIDDPEGTEDRKRELIAIVERIVIQFIDIGVDGHPVQLAQETQAKSADKTERLNPINHADKEHQRGRIDA